MLNSSRDITANLKTLTFECGLSDNENQLLFLRGRSAGLVICGCAHALFICRLAISLRIFIKAEDTDQTPDTERTLKTQGLRVGILGGGHIGKQLTHLLLEMSGLKPSSINVSTRRPENLEEFSGKGVECYYDNRRLATWADVLFLCCLPSHLPQVCTEIHSHIPPHSLIYSFPSAVPINRLARLLGHNFILKPQYDFVACESTDIWLSESCVTKALKDTSIIVASCPLSLKGGVSLDQMWVPSVLYSLLNMCTAQKIGSSQALQLLNELFKCQPSAKTFICQNFVNSAVAAMLTSDKIFPWINLVDVQSKETPLSRCLLESEALQNLISAAYCLIFSDLPSRKTV
ncbi:NADP-dependent oxidoreductase domain-containing protein 1 [Chanos chanos]|uniref:NADP-dependent oxidoreductase domain-containing protein 1 n=1 Tax=Chanos chanos TaxID=29144 RepID=A0A6J2WIU8_CHACN|nr:NADP-dependent oxidoreductase domain-containing protein 1 [Chanos chanos]